MKAETLAHAGEGVRAGIVEAAEKVRDFSDQVTDRWKNTREELERGARRIRAATKEELEEVRKRIRSHPLSLVTIVATGALVLGALGGWLVANSRRR